MDKGVDRKMITTAILILFVNVLFGLAGLLPTPASLPEGFNTAMDYMTNVVGGFIYVLPSFGVILTIAGLVLAIESGIFLFKFIDWIYNKLRGSGS